MKGIINKRMGIIAICGALLFTSVFAIYQITKQSGSFTADPASSSSVSTVTSLTEIDPGYSESDTSETYDASAATKITLNNTSIDISGSGAAASGTTLTISDEGVYIISGTLKEGQIIVNAEESDKVQIVLNGATISCSTSSPIYVEQADKVFITIAKGTVNTVTDGSDYTLTDGEDEPDAAIFSKSDLTINGTGTLKVNGNYSCGIRSKDDLIISGATLTVTSVGDGIKGKDSVSIYSGNITVTAGEDAIQSSNDTDTEKGYVSIDGGTINISAGDDGIHAETQLQVRGGTVNVTKSNEGLEGLTILISGGTANVTSSDDGLNAAGGSDSTSATTTQMGGGGSEVNSNACISITGGNLVVNASGDGIDSNGNLSISGGTAIVNGPTNNGDGPLDYAGTATISGGTLIAAGSSGMVQNFDSASSQNSLLVTYSASQAAGTPITLKDSSGNAILTFVPEKVYQSVLISTPSLTQGESYTLYSGGTIGGTGTSGMYSEKAAIGATEVVSVTLSSAATSITDTGTAITGGIGGMGKGGGMGGRPSGAPGEMSGTTQGGIRGGFES